ISSIGPLFFIVSSQAPLMQRWYALEAERGEPYALYAASNLGSFGGLLSYPLLVEPFLTLQQQSLVWSAGYALLILLVAACALTIPASRAQEAPVEASEAPSSRKILRWILLSAVPSGLMLSTTTHLTTDIVAIPLLWVLPLGLYLLSFVVAFAQRRGASDFITLLAPLILLIAGGLTFSEGSTHPLFAASLGLSLLFFVGVALHGEMYRLRPASGRLTAFYLAMAAGGVLGGLFCAILAPTLFDWTYEHPLLVVAAALLLPQQPLLKALRGMWDHPNRSLILSLVIPFAVLLISMIADARLWPDMPKLVTIGGPILIGLLAVLSLGRPIVFAACLAALMLAYGGWSTIKASLGDERFRSYFGVYTISDRPSEGVRTLVHGTTLHGLQSTKRGEETSPTSYYGVTSGVGLAMAGAPLMFGEEARIGVVGLGTGTLACYARPHQSWRFFEIDPQVVRIARNPERFSFLARCKPDAEIVVGDARLSLSRQPRNGLDLLAVDAFSSDSVPVHLLTREAMKVYGEALQPDGLLLFHISNRYLDLRPVLAANAAALGWSAAILSDEVGLGPEHGRKNYTSVWVAMSRDRGTLLLLRILSGERAREWMDLKPDPDFAGWTDDYATILPLMKDLIP
ncbi:MAG TPA: fused MFS/spermidine synthase, partial [Allosphingosinicella sp.]|nr:fused MFS/spermidine synthase [Allosphingosinicella sp.]